MLSVKTFRASVEPSYAHACHGGRCRSLGRRPGRSRLVARAMFDEMEAFTNLLSPSTASVITAMIAASSVSINLYGGLLTERKRADLAKQMERERQAAQQLSEMRSLVARYRGPLLEAAVDLESRLVAVATGRTARGGGRGVVEEEVVYTLFTLAQFLGFVELVRREGPRERSFLQQGNPQGTDTLANLLEGFRFILCGHPSALQAWHEEGAARDHPGARRRSGVPHGEHLKYTPAPEAAAATAAAATAAAAAGHGGAPAAAGPAAVVVPPSAGGDGPGSYTGAEDSRGCTGGIDGSSSGAASCVTGADADAAGPSGSTSSSREAGSSGGGCESSSSNTEGLHGWGANGQQGEDGTPAVMASNGNGSSSSSSTGNGNGGGGGAAAAGRKEGAGSRATCVIAGNCSCSLRKNGVICNRSSRHASSRSSNSDSGNGNGNGNGNGGEGVMCDIASIAQRGGDASTSTSSGSGSSSTSSSCSSSGGRGGRFSSGHWPGGSVLHMSRGTQRAVGSFMIITPVGAPRHYTLSYSDFYRRFYRDPAFAAWMRPIFEDLVGLIATPGGWPGCGAFPVNRWTRLLLLQQLLADTIDLLDPFMVRTSEQHRWRLAPVPYAPLPNAESYKERLRVLESMADTALPVMNSVFLRTGWSRSARDGHSNEYMRAGGGSAAGPGGGGSSGSLPGEAQLPGPQMDGKLYYLYSSGSLGAAGPASSGGGAAAEIHLEAAAAVGGGADSGAAVYGSGASLSYNSLDEINEDGNVIPPLYRGNIVTAAVSPFSGPMGRPGWSASAGLTAATTPTANPVPSQPSSHANGHSNGYNGQNGQNGWGDVYGASEGYWRAAEDDHSIPPPTALLVPGSRQQQEVLVQGSRGTGGQGA